MVLRLEERGWLPPPEPLQVNVSPAWLPACEAPPSLCPQKSLEHDPPTPTPSGFILMYCVTLTPHLCPHPFHRRVNPALKWQLQARALAKAQPGASTSHSAREAWKVPGDRVGGKQQEPINPPKAPRQRPAPPCTTFPLVQWEGRRWVAPGSDPRKQDRDNKVGEPF